jgi:hypothetical protein
MSWKITRGKVDFSFEYMVLKAGEWIKHDLAKSVSQLIAYQSTLLYSGLREV